jgi:hypothetical protein
MSHSFVGSSDTDHDSVTDTTKRSVANNGSNSLDCWSVTEIDILTMMSVSYHGFVTTSSPPYNHKFTNQHYCHTTSEIHT